MKVIEFTERVDGSAVIELDLTEEEKTALVEVGFITLLTEMMERQEKLYDPRSS